MKNKRKIFDKLSYLEGKTMLIDEEMDRDSKDFNDFRDFRLCKIFD